MWSFSPENVSVTLAGAFSIEGFKEGEFVMINKDEDNYTLKRVSSGSTVRTKIKSSTYTINLVLNSGSESNILLDTLLKVDMLGDKAKFPILVKDSGGSSFFFASQAWIEKEAPLKFSTSEYTTEWVIRAADGAMRSGGNEEISIIQDTLSLAASTIPYLSTLVKRIKG